ncbi:MAG: DNA (cytosine-5-)-methyltransferase [Campylobacter sp.]|uniref:DNA cytosine methyltransferase n=1 Tax=Campylobacter sp. TaxID=205 RepID=UPI0029788446|nr:DNA (cytosine-5-)-methyltransferase [Campylobacter sp.]MDD7600866.1 DNA (cytosine-5-)-methyltransferase [Campylobacteraceae bacterium]MDD7741686.1 DNA (cytosine-5-)-methyltransferase [Campylobacteraceae bacterium]MDY4120503.1 DNA (cytosine-5-)-methyltransferase [Campylobacter sp.]MDY5886834.1 DNA (cytosine-5-)-methyltransferase [Campylobacter sp.]
MSKNITFIDLFCGVGGIRIGMEQNGFKCIFSSDINEECKKTYFKNFNEMPKGDITKISESDIPRHDILCAGFPCQPFSSAGRQLGFEDTRGTLFFEICRIVKAREPKVILLENVKNLVYHDKGNTLKVILSTLESFGYFVDKKILNAADFGIPQSRERIIIVASKDKKFDFSKLMIKNKPQLKDFLDKSGNFDFLSEDEYTLISPEIRKRQLSGLIFAGYRNKKIRTAGVRPGTEHLSRVHRQCNRIHSVFGTFPTLNSQESSGRFFILTEENKVRRLTLNECWRIMGFPENYQKVSSQSEQYKQLGNSVCIPMISAISKQIKEQFFKDKI